MPTRLSSHALRSVMVRHSRHIFQLFGLSILLCLFAARVLFFQNVAFSTPDKIIFLVLAGLAGIFLLLSFTIGTSKSRNFLAKLLQVPENETAVGDQDKLSRSLEMSILLIAYGIIFVLYFYFKRAALNLDVARYFNDTRQYITSAAYQLSDYRFWFGLRSFSLPLFYKIVGYAFYNYQEQNAMNRVSYYQFIFSILCWTGLAASFSLLMKRKYAKVIAFACILLLGASLYVTQWDNSMLSESISTSLMVLFMAILIIAGILWDRRQSVSAWKQILFIILIFIVAILFVFSRDTNGYLLLAFAGGMAIGLFFHSIRRHPLIFSYVAVMAGFLVIFAWLNASMNIGKRYVVPLFFTVVYRYIPDQTSLDYFVAHGMPFDDRYLTLRSLNNRQLMDAENAEKSVTALWDWVDDHGKNVFVGYLLSRPGYTLFAPFEDIQIWMNGTNTLYRKILTPTPFRITLLSDLIYPTWKWTPLLFLFLFVICSWSVWKSRGREMIWWLILILFLSIYPLALVLWHTNPEDLERHAFQIVLQVRLASWMTIALLIDRGLAYLKEHTRLGDFIA
ncbi:MAG TPA: hypothetical protein VMC09_01810 [Anaerolineales bacterium]|nr:hypothetical protein [Anaerolineales bacterium]